MATPATTPTEEDEVIPPTESALTLVEEDDVGVEDTNSTPTFAPSSSSSSSSSPSSSEVTYPLTRDGSKIVQWNATHRVGHQLGLHSLSSPFAIGGGETGKIDRTLYATTAAAFLGWKHVQERRGDVLPELPSLLKGKCDDLSWTFELRDNEYSGIQAAKNLMDAVVNYDTTTNTNTTTNATVVPGGGNLRKLEPFMFYGGYFSSISKPLAILGGALELPQAAISSAQSLGDEPYFSSPVASAIGDGQAAIRFYEALGVDRVACIYVEDSWAGGYHAAFRAKALSVGIRVSSFGVDNTLASMEKAIAQVKDTKLRYVLAIIHDWTNVLPLAYREGVIGNPEFSWLAAETLSFVDDDYRLSRSGASLLEDEDIEKFDKTTLPTEGEETEFQLAQALHGIGVLTAHFTPNVPFQKAMYRMGNDPQLQQEYVAAWHPDVQPLFEGFDFSDIEVDHLKMSTFDVNILLGVAACHTPRALFTGPELYETIRTTSFRGTTGNVSLDYTTGVRNPETVPYGVRYISISDTRSDATSYRFESRMSAVINGDGLEWNTPFRFWDNTTVPPPTVAPHVHDTNLIPTGALAIGYVMCGIAVVASVGLAIWTILNRGKPYIRASQPGFLCQLCLGTFLMAGAIVPFSFPGSSPKPSPDANLDVACMAVVWLIYPGSVVALSALLSKTWRLIKLVKAGQQMRRINVEMKDVMLPLGIMMPVNLICLICITVVTPYRYARVEEDNYDVFGRSLSSYGTCNYWKPPDQRVWAFVVPMWLVNFGGMIVGLYQCWITRNMASEISESGNVTLSMGSMFETMCLGGPILVLSANNPTAFFVTGSFMLLVWCMTILLPIFLPKFSERERRAQSVMAFLRKGATAKKNKRDSNATESSGTQRLSNFSSAMANSTMMDDESNARRGTRVYRPSNAAAINNKLQGVSGLDFSA